MSDGLSCSLYDYQSMLNPSVTGVPLRYRFVTMKETVLSRLTTNFSQQVYYFCWQKSPAFHEQ